jgi:two-component system nitrogen regulation response regulator GlnG
MPDILIIDDEPSVSWAYSKAAKSLGHKAVVAGSAEDGLAALARQPFDLALLDIQLPGMSGLEALNRMSAHYGRMPVIVLTAYGTMETAVEAIRRGAFEYLIKPVDLADLKMAIQSGLAAAEARRASPAAAAADAGEGIVGKCPAMQEVYKRVGAAAASDLPVLLEGETGTGKELVAQSIHRHGGRSGGPFIVVNCTCLPRELLESELFGHVKGAFTGAIADKPGQVELARGGTLFLDEVGELPPDTQSSLLRFADTRKAGRVGSQHQYEVDVRLVAATNRNLRIEVETGRFRRDLYYRLNALTVRLPPLRDRGEDLTILTDHFLRRAAARMPAGDQARVPQITEEARRKLGTHSWPGNVRELKNAIEHAVLMARGGPIRPEHLPETLREAGVVGSDDLRDRLARLAGALVDERLTGDPGGADFTALMTEFEKPLLAAGLRKFGGNQARLAAALKLHRTTLRKKLREYGLIEAGGDDADDDS